MTAAPTTHEHFPELNEAKFADKIRLLTLSQIGCKRSEEAVDRGYICVIPYRSAGRRSFPGKWVAPEDADQLNDLIPAIRAQREEIALKNKEQSLREAQTKQKKMDAHHDRIRDLVTAFPVLSSPSATSLLRATLPHNCYQQLFDYLKREQLHSLQNGRIVRKGGMLQLKPTAEEKQSYALPPSIDINFEEGCLLALNGETAIHARVIAAAEAQQKAIENLTAKLDKGRPAWVMPAALKQCVSKLLQMPTASRPNFAPELLLKSMSTTLLSDAGIRIHNKRQYIELAADVQAANLPLRITSTTEITVKDLWNGSAKTTLDEALIEHCSRHSADLAKEAQDAIDRLNGAAAISDQNSALLQMDAPKWRDMVARAWKSAHGHPSALQSHMERLCRERQYALKIAEMRRALPDRLADLYPLARAIARRLKLIIGPTNSGKTHQALDRLKQASQGIYLGPLRLLALEVRDRLEAEGISASLVTGELIECRDNASISACTIEMLDFDKRVEVAIIDEVQMLADPQRGSAWLHAILGAPADEVWLLGSPEAEEAVAALATYLGEPLEIVRTERLAPLAINEKPTKLHEIPDQSAVIAFSRRAVLDIAAELQGKHGKSCAVIYGALSPEVRRTQSERFRSGQAQVVVATDAIAMGLNLPVKGVYFSTSTKWNGACDERLDDALVWQIAGRAGRFGIHDSGKVGALDKTTLKDIQKQLSHRPGLIAKQYRHGATWPLVRVVAQHLASTNLQDILTVFYRDLTLSSDVRFRPQLGQDQLCLAEELDKSTLDLRDKLTLSNAPVPLHKNMLPLEFGKFVKAISQGSPMPLKHMERYFAEATANQQENAEYAVKMLTLYSWMHYRYPEIFPDLEKVQTEIATLNMSISNHLRIQSGRQCNSCGRVLTWRHPFPTCDSCYRARRSRWHDDWY